MTVKELKEAIALLPDDMIVIIQKDSEGNDYSPLREADTDCVYIAETTWYGQVYPINWSAEDADMEDEEWEEIKSKPRVLVLAPVN